MDNINDALHQMRFSKEARGGFTRVRHDLTTRAEIISEFIKFCSQVNKEDDVLLYYAGHGLQHDGATYLVPTNAEEPVTPANIQDVCVSVGELMVMISKREPRVKLFVIDACQTKLDPVDLIAGSGGEVKEDRPSPQQPDVQQPSLDTADPTSTDGEPSIAPQEVVAEEEKGSTGQRPLLIRVTSRGLRKLKAKHVGIQNVTDLFQSNLGRNIYTLYASSPGTVALETFRGGVFSNAFLENITKPKVTLSKLCSSISDDIKKLGYGNQLPTTGRMTLESDMLSWRFFVDDIEVTSTMKDGDNTTATLQQA